MTLLSTTGSTRALRVLPAAVLGAVLGAGATVALPATPAHAAACEPGTGVTVVVDFGPLGGGTQVGCDAGGAGSRASDATEGAGFSLDFVASQPGFVCKVHGKPASEPCQRTPPTNAYWGLFWSDGKGGWTYSSLGASSLEVPAGGSVGWRWQNGGSRDNPSAAPNSGSTPEPAPEPKPEPKPDPKPDKGGDGGGSGGSGSGGGGGGQQGSSEVPPSSTPTPEESRSPEAEEPSQKPSPKASRREKERERPDGKSRDRKSAEGTPSAAATPEAEDDEVTDAIAPVADDADGGGGDTTMLLLAAALVVVLGAAAGVTAWRRRS
jgi:hypothetical protein